FSLERRPGWFRRPFAPSLDRIDTSTGYEAGNCRLVCVLANIALNEWGEDVFARVAIGVALKRRALFRGRTRPPASNHKIGWPEVRAMREGYADGVSTSDLIAQYNVSSSTVYRILKGVVWQDPDYPPRRLRGEGMPAIPKSS